MARVGVIGHDGLSLRQDYQQLLGGAEVIEDQSGIIPVYDPRQKLRKPGENVFLIGDAATQVKATTYGGIIYGLLAAQYLAEDPEGYEHRMNAKLGRDLWISLKMREFMNAMTEKQADELIDIFERQRNRQIIERHDRDFPSKFIVQLLMKEAQLWKLGFGLLKNRAWGRPRRSPSRDAQPGPLQPPKTGSIRPRVPAFTMKRSPAAGYFSSCSGLSPFFPVVMYSSSSSGPLNAMQVAVGTGTSTWPTFRPSGS